MFTVVDRQHRLLVRPVLLLGASLMAVSLLATGCRKADETASETASAQTSSQDTAGAARDGDSTSVGAAIATATGLAGLQVPGNFPSDLWVPSAGMIVQATANEGTANLTMTVPSMPDRVAADALAAMTASGWQQKDQRTNASGMQQTTFVKGDGLVTYSAHLGHDKASTVLSIRKRPADR